MAKETEPAREESLARGGVRNYANALEVDFTLAEFILDFLQRFGADSPAARQCRLVTSPANMSAFRDTMSAAIADYERRYGALLPARDEER